MKTITQVLVAITAYYTILEWGSNIAYQQRGYIAVGGEYLFAILVGVAVYYACRKWL